MIRYAICLVAFICTVQYVRAQKDSVTVNGFYVGLGGARPIADIYFYPHVKPYFQERFPLNFILENDARSKTIKPSAFFSYMRKHHVFLFAIGYFSNHYNDSKSRVIFTKDFNTSLNWRYTFGLQKLNKYIRPFIGFQCEYSIKKSTAVEPHDGYNANKGYSSTNGFICRVPVGVGYNYKKIICSLYADFSFWARFKGDIDYYIYSWDSVYKEGDFSFSEIKNVDYFIQTKTFLNSLNLSVNYKLF